MKSGSQLTKAMLRYCSSCRRRAPQAESLSTAGPLTPQCVTSTGPSYSSFSPATRTRARGTLTPGSSRSGESGTLKVNRLGTGS